MIAKSPHVASFSAIRPAFESELGSVAQLDSAALPILSGTYSCESGGVAGRYNGG